MSESQEAGIDCSEGRHPAALVMPTLRFGIGRCGRCGALIDWLGRSAKTASDSDE